MAISPPSRSGGTRPLRGRRGHPWRARHDQRWRVALRGGTFRFERPTSEVEALARTAWESSPASSVLTWRSPVLTIHADDDRNVRFSQTVDLVQRLLGAKGVEVEEITIVDDTHHFMRHVNQKRVNAAIAVIPRRSSSR